jgi:integrase
MAHLFKPVVIRYRLPDGKAVPKGTPAARKVRERTKKWYASYEDGDGMPARKPLCADKSAANTMLNELVKKSSRERAGDRDPFEEHRKRPLAEHQADFKRHLEAKGNTGKHVRITDRRLGAMLDGIQAKRLADLSASRLAEWLAEQRATGLGVTTSNYYLKVAKSFGRWLVQDRRLSHNPFDHLTGLNPQTDVRRERRTLGVDEFGRLVEAAKAGEPYRELSGLDRALLYTVAANTGLRAGELASLTADSFDLEADQPTVAVEAAYSKHRRHDVLPLRADLAVLLRPFVSDLRSRATSAVQDCVEREDGSEAVAGGDSASATRLWPGTWADRAAEMLAGDLAAARQVWIDEAKTDKEKQARIKSDYLAYTDDAGRVFDFHAQRHQFISNLARGGASPKEAQALARHSTITLTMDRYTHLGIVDLSAALDRLPKLPGGDFSESDVNVLASTGTDDARPGNVALPVALDVAERSVPTRPELSVIGSEAIDHADSQAAKSPEESGTLEPSCTELSPDGESTPGRNRTCNLRIRSPLLYPIELRAQTFI